MSEEGRPLRTFLAIRRPPRLNHLPYKPLPSTTIRQHTPISHFRSHFLNSSALHKAFYYESTTPLLAYLQVLNHRCIVCVLLLLLQSHTYLHTP
jgi:hypothetical protein